MEKYYSVNQLARTKDDKGNPRDISEYGQEISKELAYCKPSWGYSHIAVDESGKRRMISENWDSSD